jgi:hypothetical protein
VREGGDVSTTWGPTTIAANADDCSVYQTTIQASVYIGCHSSVGSYRAGFRWLNVTVPKDAIIVSSSFTINAEQDNSQATCSCLVKGEANATPATFSTYADFNGRTRTSHSAAWSVGAWTNNTAYTTPDLAAVIQEIVSLAGWASGNNLALFVEDNGSTAGALRRGFCKEDYQPYSARLTIVWNPATTAYIPGIMQTKVIGIGGLTIGG